MVIAATISALRHAGARLRDAQLHGRARHPRPGGLGSFDGDFAY